MTKILILGANSFVATGFVESLKKKCIEYDTFSRGDNILRKGNKVYGKYIEIDSNCELAPVYDMIVNYAVLKNQSIDENIKYLQALVRMCIEHNVKRLIHFSSLMTYGYHVGRIDEKTPIETLEDTWKKGYGEIKIAVDQYLLSIKDTLPFEVVLVRPGYVIADNRSCPFIKPLPFGITLIKGDSKSKTPVVKRDDIHKAILKIVETDNNLPVYHFFPNDGMTKYRFARQKGYKHLIPMPRLIFKYLPWVLMKIGIMPKAMYSRFDGMYNECEFSSEFTEKKLGIKFT